MQRRLRLGGPRRPPFASPMARPATVAASLLLIFLMASRPHAGATNGPSAARLTIDAGDAGTFIPGRPVPVRVQVDSDRLIRGQLVVTAGAAKLSQAVEVAGGSSKQFELTLPTVSAPSGGPQLKLQVELTEQQTRLGTIGATLNAAPDVELVGLLPSLLAGAPLPSSVPLAAEAGTARFVALSAQDLALAPASLGPLSAVALGPDDLGQLGATVRQALLAWTASGGRLLIDARPGDTVAGLPPGWQAAGPQPVSAGRGEVVATGGAMAAAKWSGLIRPANHAADTSQSAFNVSSPLSNSLANDAGLTTPRLPWLIGFLVAYIVVVGPISFGLLRRLGRAELLWIVIPVVALVFAASGYAVGAKERSGVKIVHATVVDTTAAGGSAVTFVGIVSRSEATTRVDAPPGWVMQRYSDPSGGPQAFVGSGGLSTAVISDGVQGRLKLSTGQFAIVEARGASQFPGHLTVSARSASDGHAAGTVTNNTPWTLQDVSVLIGAAGTDVGTLAAGAKADWAISAGPNTNANANGAGSVELQLWGQTALDGFGGFGFNGPRGFIGPGGDLAQGQPASAGVDKRPVSQSVWQAAPSGLGPGSRGNGVAVAVGWTGQYRSAVSVGGHGPVARGRTAIVGTAPVGGTGAGVGDLAIRRTLLRGNLTQVGPGMFADMTNAGQPVLLGWSVPAPATGRPMVLSIPGSTGRVEVWGAQGWRTLSEGTDPAKNGGIAGPQPVIPVPPAPSAPNQAPNGATLSPPSTFTPVPIPVPFPGNGPAGFAGVTDLSLAPGDSHDDAVYIRIAGVGSGRPFDLNSVDLRVRA